MVLSGIVEDKLVFPFLFVYNTSVKNVATHDNKENGNTMKFDLSLEEILLHQNQENSIIVSKKLEITREELISEYNKDEVNFFNTLRETIYMFHFVNGFITQVSDETMKNMYDTLIQNPLYKGICYCASERDDLSTQNEYERKKSVCIDLIYLQ